MEILEYSYVGMEMGFAVMIGAGIGWYLDAKVFDGRTVPWLTLLFLFLGMAAAGRAFYRTAKKMRQSMREGEDGQG